MTNTAKKPIPKNPTLVVSKYLVQVGPDDSDNKVTIETAATSELMARKIISDYLGCSFKATKIKR